MCTKWCNLFLRCHRGNTAWKLYLFSWPDIATHWLAWGKLAPDWFIPVWPVIGWPPYWDQFSLICFWYFSVCGCNPPYVQCPIAPESTPRLQYCSLLRGVKLNLTVLCYAQYISPNKERKCWNFPCQSESGGRGGGSYKRLPHMRGYSWKQGTEDDVLSFLELLWTRLYTMKDFQGRNWRSPSIRQSVMVCV